MARTIAQIQAQILTAKNAEPELAEMTSASKRAIFNLWAFITASCVAILEQLIDLFTTQTEATVARSAGTSNLWVQDKMFKFQYDATDPQIIQLINTIPAYPVEDASKRIITACSVSSQVSNEVNIKVAKGNPYQALGGSEKTAAQGYIDTIGTSGIKYTVISLAPDNLYIDGTIYYLGQYSAIIKTNVIAAINDYLQKLSLTNFDGTIKMSDLEQLIRNVTGVVDVVLNRVRIRADTDMFAGGIDLILATAIIQRLAHPVAGYIISETLGGFTLNDSLQFVSQ